MAFQPAKDTEPIPGYRLLEKLGTGGYGEVWKVTAPGGLTKAIKIVYGDMGGARAGQELKALERIKQVRHPFLLSLERFEILDGQLFIVTELADFCLMDRFQACREAGQKGIPRDELIGYLRDAAEALDYMGETHGLQHLDIKPQNLLIVSGRIKVADFGLVKELVGTSVTATGGVTPIYATPEAFDGRVSRYSDQYSLAIVYQEMLTGVRPFPGITMMQLAAQHTGSPPLLQPLPAGDRPAIARALAKVPEHRFPSCAKMVEALLTGRLTSTTNPVVTPEQIARRSSGLVPRVNSPPPPPTVSLSPPPVSPSRQTPQTVAGHRTPVRPPGERPPAAAPAPRPVAEHAGPASPRAEGEGAAGPSAFETPLPGGAAGLRPTLFLGLGGLACAALRPLRRRLHHHFGGLAKAPVYRVLLVDTDREEVRLARQGEPGEALESTETLLAPLHLPEYYRPESKKLLRWLDRRWLYGIPRSLLTEGLRPLGRLAFVENAAALLSHLRDLLAQITRPEAMAETAAATGLPPRDAVPRVFVVASVAGGTGGGMLLGVAYAVRQVLGELGVSARGLCGVLLHATSPKPSDQQMARINACATLQELAHFSQPDAPYPGDPEKGLDAFAPGEAPFEDCYLVHLGDGLDRARAAEAARNVAEYLFLDATPEGGAFLDRFRHETRPPPPAGTADGDPGPGGLVRTFGLTRLGADGPAAAQRDALFCCRRLTELWSGEAGDGKDDTIAKEAEQQLAGLGLDADALPGRICGAIVKQLGKSPDSFLAQLIAPDEGATSEQAVRQALDRTDQLLGLTTDLDERGDSDRTPLTAAVYQSAMGYAATLADTLVDWLLELVETPGKRLQAADRASLWTAKHLRGLTDQFRGQLQLVRDQCQLLRELVLTGKVGKKGSGLRWLGRHRSREDAASPLRKLLEYGKLRMQELVLTNALDVVGIVQGPLGRFVQELAVCRQRLGEVAVPFREKTGRDEPARGRGGRGPRASAVPAEVVRRFDEAMQQELLGPQGGLWGVFAGSQAIRRGAPPPDAPARPVLAPEVLRQELLSRARAFLRAALPERNAAQAFLEAQPDAEQARPVLLRHLEEARPKLRVEGEREHLLLGVPDCPAKAEVLDLVAEALPDQPLTAVGSEEDLFLVYEGAGYPLGEMAAALVGTEAPEAELVRRVMTRLDVPWSFWTAAPA
jgi:serine/threonine protein kinase